MKYTKDEYLMHDHNTNIMNVLHGEYGSLVFKAR